MIDVSQTRPKAKPHGSRLARASKASTVTHEVILRIVHISSWLAYGVSRLADDSGGRQHKSWDG
jgi:hypothetical protein